MPGLVGFVGLEHPDEGREHLRKMTLALEPSPEYRVDYYHEPGIGLGRVGHKFVDAGPQPCWNESMTLCAVMEGELYNSAELRQDLIQRGESVHSNNEIELVLKLYQLYGDDFPVHLNGAFVVAIWDQLRRRLVLVNDRLGLQPLYYADYNGGMSFASGVRALLADPALPRRTDRVAIAEFLTFDHLLDDRTLLESVRLLPQGSLLIFVAGQVQIKRYYDICFPREYKLRSEEDYMEEFLHLVQRAVKRQVGADDRQLGILLSGGLDSRLLLADLSAVSNGKPIHSFTWGMPGCDDARNAREIARLLGSQHHFFELKPDWLLGLAHEAVRLTDGMGNLVNLHALATLQEEASIANVLFKGFLGDAMMGFGLRQQFWASYDEPTWVQAHLQVHTDQGVITFNNQDRQQLFSDALRSEVGTAVIDHYVAGMKEAPSDSMADQRIYFDYRQRVPRMTIKGVEVVRSKVVTRLPFADNDLVEFSLRLPPGLRYERRLMKNAFIRAFPKLAQVPVTETGLPMMLCSRDVLLRANYVLRWHLNSMGLKWISTNLRRPYKDYDQWFRTVLRAWMESILLSPQALERGYYNPEYVRQKVAEHQAGANYAVRLGVLLAIEIWHQMYLD